MVLGDGVERRPSAAMLCRLRAKGRGLRRRTHTSDLRGDLGYPVEARLAGGRLDSREQESMGRAVSLPGGFKRHSLWRQWELLMAHLIGVFWNGDLLGRWGWRSRLVGEFLGEGIQDRFVRQPLTFLDHLDALSADLHPVYP